MDSLTPAQSRFLRALVKAKSLQEAATVCDVSIRTARRYAASPAFQSAWADLQAAMLQDLGHMVAYQAAGAMDVLADIAPGLVLMGRECLRRGRF